MNDDRLTMLEKRADGNDRRWEDHEKRHLTLDRSIVTIETDLKEMRAAQATLATRADLQQAINIVLRDALNSLPARHAVIWAAITALVALAAIFYPR